jgi:hypothetical protein
MKLLIDNYDGNGPRDYTSAVEPGARFVITRKLNQPTKLVAALVTNGTGFVVPVNGGRITLVMQSGAFLFTGYLTAAPQLEYLGWGTYGAVYRVHLAASSDEFLLDDKRLPVCAPFVNRSAGSALRQLTQDISPGVFDLSAIQNVDTVVEYASDPQKTWSVQSAEIAAQARAAYQLTNGSLSLTAVGATTHTLNENDATFAPEGLMIVPANSLINDVTVVGDEQPQAYVTDYFIGDGLTERFYLSQTPYTKTSTTVFDEEYTGPRLDPTRWVVTDPTNAVSIVNGNLQIAGGTGNDGGTLVEFIEQVELGGAVVMQHGDVVFNAPSSSVIGGLYAGTVSIGGCLAGFQVAPNGTQNNIQALVNGSAAGTPLTTITGHHYVMTTRLYSQEVYRLQQIFHSSAHPAGAGYGGGAIVANVHLVLEVHDIDPSNPASQVAPSTVLYDGEIADAPGFCTYALINAANLQCAIAFTELIDAIDTEVRSALPGATFSTLLVGDLSEGAECRTTSTELTFFSAYVPAANQQIEVHYRGRGRAIARITNPASVAAQQRGIDTGVHGVVRRVKLPPARTSADCEQAALAILDDAVNPAYSGQYETWSDFLPDGATDILPGDAMNINAPSRGTAFTAIVREVQITVEDLAGEHSRYLVQFAMDAARPLAFEFEASSLTALPDVTSYANTQVGNIYIADLTSAQITQVTSTTVTIDAGNAPPSGGGFEVRWSDEGWGVGNNRNLLGRFTAQTFTLPRLARTADFFVQQYDASNPPRYSRYSAALHLDFPLGATM